MSGLAISVHSVCACRDQYDCDLSRSITDYSCCRISPSVEGIGYLVQYAYLLIVQLATREYECTSLFEFSVALCPHRPSGLSGTESPGRPPKLLHSS